MAKPIRLGMVGGGRDAFIGAVHRMAATLDGGVDFVAGALSSSPEKAQIAAIKSRIGVLSPFPFTSPANVGVARMIPAVTTVAKDKILLVIVFSLLF